MYDFVDRPVTSLNRGGRLLIGAMRHWVRAVQAGRCPCGDVGPAFGKWNLMAGFPHFHDMMVALNQNALEKQRFGPVGCERVSEHEALIIAMIRALRSQPADQVAHTAALVVGEAQVSQLLVPMTALARTLADANIFPAAPIFDPDCTRFSND